MIGRKDTAVILHHRPRAAQQIAGAGIIAQARPFGHHIAIFGGCQISHVWPALGKAQEIAFHRCHRGLLQHDLRQPNTIRVGGLALLAGCRADTPRHDAGMVVIPRQKRPADLGCCVGRCGLRLAGGVTQSLCPLSGLWAGLWPVGA